MEPLLVSQLLPIGVIMLLASAIQGVVGFAFSLFSLPLLLGAGLSLPQSVCVLLVHTLCQRIHMCIHLRSDIQWRKVLPVAAPALVGLPIGLWLLTATQNLDHAWIKAIVGGVILAVVIARMVVRVKPREHLHWAWGQIAGLCSGVLRGFLNAGGPPMVLWTYAHNWTSRQLRVSALAVSLVSVPPQTALLWIKFGAAFPLVCGMAATLIPVTLLGGAIGVRLGHRLPPERLRPIAYALLAVMGLKGLLVPWL
jgi:uncharacterized protein